MQAAPNLLSPRKNSLLLRLVSFLALVVGAPIFAVGMHSEGKDSAIVFMLVFLVLVLPDLFIKLFRSPVLAAAGQQQLIVGYYLKRKRTVALPEVRGYSRISEQTNDGKERGLILYLEDGGHIVFTEINVQDCATLSVYLQSEGVGYLGEEKLGPWFLSNFRYGEK